MAKRSSSQCKVRVLLKNVNIKKAIRDQELEELSKTVKFLETYIVKYSEDCQNMGESLQKAENIIKDYENRLAGQANHQITLTEEILNLQQQLDQMRIKSEQVLKENKQKELEQELSKQKLLTELERLRNILSMSSEEILHASRSRLKTTKKIEKLFKICQIPKKCVLEIMDPDSSLIKSPVFFAKIARLSAENLRLQEENSHLLQKIDEPTRSSDFKDLLQDSKGLKYFRNKGKCGKPSCSSNSFFLSNWIPRPIHSALEDFNAKHDSLVASAVVNLFYKLNKIWQIRENKRIERVKNQYGCEIAQLQKRVSPDSTNSLKKTTKMHTRNTSMGKIRESISIEYKIASENIIQLVKEFLDKTKRNFNVVESDNWLVESLLTILAKFTDKVLSII